MSKPINKSEHPNKKMAFKVENPEQSRQLQEILFKQGYRWSSGNEYPKHLEETYIYTSSFGFFGDLTHSTEFNLDVDQVLMNTQDYINEYKEEIFNVKLSTSKEASDGSSADYYKFPEDVRELQDIISFKDMNAQIAEIFRACYRYGQVSHSSKLRDAKKIKFYAEAEIKRLEKYGE